MEAKGKTMIKVVGILMLIGGIFNVLTGILSLAGGGLMAAGAAADPSIAAEASSLTGMFMAYAVMCLAYGIVYIITGVVGMKNCTKVDQAAKCQKWGIIALAIAVITLIFGFITDAFAITSLFVLLLPILFILGARKNMQGA